MARKSGSPPRSTPPTSPAHWTSSKVKTVFEAQTIIVFALVTLAMGGVVWVFVYPHLSGERNAERRLASVAKSEPIATRTNAARTGQKNRREEVEESLKELDDRQKKSAKQSLSTKISQAGLDWSKQRFYITSGILGAVAFIVGLLADVGLLISLVIAFVAAVGLPLWLLRYLKKRRENKFLNAFPDAVDVIVRGIKTGLPLGDCMKVIASEAQEPVKSEFRTIMETQSVGMPLGDACAKLFERIPLPEANFFGIVITIQQKAGGNLSEALGNLSRVLRDRKKMKAKIQAVSMEAKASASIIAALPIAVMTIVWLTSPDYIELLFVSSTGHMLLAGSAVWMFMGVLVMRKMINFDF
jgi:tight adherence protein B